MHVVMSTLTLHGLSIVTLKYIQKQDYLAVNINIL